MNHPIYSMSRWLIFFCCCIWHTFNCFSFLLNRMFAFMLHSEYITSCFMAKRVIWHDFQGSSHKQAGQTFHCFVQTVIFFSTVWMKICSFRLFQVSFIPCVSDTLVGDSLSAQLIYRGKVVFATHSTIFTDTNQNYISRTCKPRKLKSAKNKLLVFRQKPRKFGDAKISHYTVEQW